MTNQHMTSDARNARTGGEILIDALRIHGVDTVFSVPGESFLPAIDALYQSREQIRLVVCRQEHSAGHMADAYGKLHNTPGVCFVTRGPGATHASVAVHTAMQDSTPMVLFVGLVARRVRGREAWQEIDIERTFGSLAKWAVEIDRIERIPEIVGRAFQVATSGRAGPVVVGLPEDLLYETADVADAAHWQRVQPHPGPEDMDHLEQLLADAQRPYVLAGGSGWDANACEALALFAERFDLPVGTGFRRQDLFDNTHPNYAGDLGVGVSPAIFERVQQSDLVIALGTRLSETTTSDYTLLGVPRPAATLVHVHGDAAELGRVYHADLMINAGVRQFCAAALRLPAPTSVPWSDWTHAANADYLENLRPAPSNAVLDMAHIVLRLQQRLPSTTIVANGAGNYAGWLHRFWQYRGLRTQLAPTSGAMGYGLPAAITAALAYPQRQVVCVAGDGCFQMCLNELATIQQYRLKILILIVNNGMWGSIRMHQEIHYPGNVYGTTLENPDFVALARAYGLAAECVERTADFDAALTRALDTDGSALVELRTDPNSITSRTTLHALRERALNARVVES